MSESAETPSSEVLAIDGPAGAGKSTIARRVADRLGWAYLDTGAMYRAVTREALDRGLEPGDAAAVAALASDLDLVLAPDGRVTVGGADVTARLRSPEVTEAVSTVAAIPAVRDVMVRHSKPGRRTGAVLLVNSAGRLAGIFTDSDLARMFEQRRDHLLDTPVSSVMTAQPTTIGPDVLLPEAIHLMSERKLSELPVLNEQRQPLGLLDITDVLECADPEMQQQATDLNNSPSHSQPWRQAS